jgi:hypothetical protein
MDAVVRARFFRVTDQPEGISDFPDLLLSEAKKPLSEREKDVAIRVSGDDGADPAGAVLFRVEQCSTE